MFTRAGPPMSLVVGEGSEREQCRFLSLQPVFSHSLHYPQSKWALLVLIPGWVGCVCSRPLWVSPTNSPVRLEVSPTAATHTGFTARDFEALVSHAGTLGCEVYLAPQLSLPVYPHTNVGLPGPPAAALLQVLSTPTAHLCPSYQFG